MNSQHVDTLIIGAGQAGLTTGYHLSTARAPVPHRGRQSADR
jgi:cation diffusion facilitator CzcD-associated flavoprotein CzcO